VRVTKVTATCWSAELKKLHTHGHPWSRPLPRGSAGCQRGGQRGRSRNKDMRSLFLGLDRLSYRELWLAAQVWGEWVTELFCTFLGKEMGTAWLAALETTQDLVS
jgi:hypothetical protein